MAYSNPTPPIYLPQPSMSASYDAAKSNKGGFLGPPQMDPPQPSSTGPSLSLPMVPPPQNTNQDRMSNIQAIMDARRAAMARRNTTPLQPRGGNQMTNWPSPVGGGSLASIYGPGRGMGTPMPVDGLRFRPGYPGVGGVRISDQAFWQRPDGSIGSGFTPGSTPFGGGGVGGGQSTNVRRDGQQFTGNFQQYGDTSYPDWFIAAGQQNGMNPQQMAQAWANYAPAGQSQDGGNRLATGPAPAQPQPGRMPQPQTPRPMLPNQVPQQPQMPWQQGGFDPYQYASQFYGGFNY